MDNKVVKMTDRDLHCVARTLQSLYRDAGISCLHCKYGLECGKRFREGEIYPFHETWDKLKKLTDVNIRLHRESKDILDGSWIEHFPELYEEFLNLPIKEQEKRLHDPDILKYADEYCPENSELNELHTEKSVGNLGEPLLKKIYEELVLIRKELQVIQSNLEPKEKNADSIAKEIADRLEVILQEVHY